jgi:hypothetical protein
LANTASQPDATRPKVLDVDRSRDFRIIILK